MRLGGRKDLDGTARRADPPLGSKDPDLLSWAKRRGYVVVSNDVGQCHGLSRDTFVDASKARSAFLGHPPLPNRRMPRYHGRIALIGVRRVDPGILLQSFGQTI
jgi:hypothetical protein